MRSGNEADSIFNNRIADLRTQLSGLVIQNEALDSLLDVTQSAIAANYVPDSSALAQNDTGALGAQMVADTNTVMVTKEDAVADTFDLVLVDPVPSTDSLSNIPGSDTGKISGTLSTVVKETSDPKLKDSLQNNTILNNSPRDLLTGNIVVAPLINKDTVSQSPVNIQKDTAVLRNNISATEDSLSNKTSIHKALNNTAVTNTKNAATQPQKDSLNNKSRSTQGREDLSTANNVAVLPAENKSAKDTSQLIISNNDEVARLKTQLADLQKEKEDLMQQMNKTTEPPVSAPEKPNLISGNENTATQEDINALKSEIQSLKHTIETNGDNRVATPQRSFLPPIVPAVGIGMGKTKVEKVIQHDTIFVDRPAASASQIDTVRITDTFMVRDTVRVSDTIKHVVRDTVQQTIVKDSLITVTNVVDKQMENLLALPPYVILFDLGKSNVKLVYRKRLDYYAEQLKKHKDLKVIITGHTDKTGSIANNQILSEKRAKSISGYLTGKGVGSNAMQISSLGETEPIAADDTKEGQSQNRRVEVLFKEK